MPNAREDHHCWCSTKKRPVRAPHGDHHEFCPYHPDHFYRAGRHCILCEAEADIAEKRQKQQKAKEQREARKSEEEAWYKDTSKTRKERSPKGKNGQGKGAVRSAAEKEARAKKQKQKELVILAVDVFCAVWKLGKLANKVHKELKKL